MKILFYYFMGGGGGSANLRLLLTALAQNFPEDQIDVLCHPRSDLATLSHRDNLVVRPLPRGLPAEAVRLAMGEGGLQREARRLGADVLWCVNLGAYRRGPVPQVLSLRNAFQVYPWDEVARFHGRGRIPLAGLRWFTRRTLRACSGVILQTGRMASAVQGVLDGPLPYRVISKPLESEAEVVPEPLSAALASSLRPSGAHPPFTFLYVATASPHKNHGVLVEAFRRLSARGVPARLVLTVTPRELSRLCGSVSDRLVESGVVLPVGWVDKVHLRALYDACDACLMPSVLESLSSSHLEAMGWGKPQVAADLPYALDLCGDAALYAPPGDGEVWARQAEALVRDDALRRRLVEAGRAVAATLPKDWADNARRVRAFLAEVAGR